MPDHVRQSGVCDHLSAVTSPRFWPESLPKPVRGADIPIQKMMRDECLIS
jgi:hypothetical protein